LFSSAFKHSRRAIWEGGDTTGWKKPVGGAINPMFLKRRFLNLVSFTVDVRVVTEHRADEKWPPLCHPPAEKN